MYFADRLSATFCARDSIQMKAPLRPGLCFIPRASAGTEPGDECGVGRLAMTGRPSVMASPGRWFESRRSGRLRAGPIGCSGARCAPMWAIIEL
jgi:hypothetical protein